MKVNYFKIYTRGKIFKNKKKEGSGRKVVEEFVTEEERGKYFFTIKNHFADSFPNEQKELSYMHPEILEDEERLRNIDQNDMVRVAYIDRQGRKIEEEWNFYEYLRRIGFHGATNKKQTPFNAYQEKIKSVNNVKKLLCESHFKVLQSRNKSAVGSDRFFSHKSSREQQLKTREKEDPYFCNMMEKSGFMHYQDLSMLHDYLDAVDVMLEFDSGEGEPVYLGVQRTLAKKNGTTYKRKKKKIDSQPIWFIPEYPERNPILRIVLGEGVEEYFKQDGSTRLDGDREINQKTADAKTLQVLLEAQASVDYHIDHINEIKEEDIRTRHLQYFQKYKRALEAAIERVFAQSSLESEDVEKVKRKIVGVKLKRSANKKSDKKQEEGKKDEMENEKDEMVEYRKNTDRYANILSRVDGFSIYPNKGEDGYNLMVEIEELGVVINVLENHETAGQKSFKARKKSVEKNPIKDIEDKKIVEVLLKNDFIEEFFNTSENSVKKVFKNTFANQEEAIGVLKTFNFLSLVDVVVNPYKKELEKQGKQSDVALIEKIHKTLIERKREVSRKYKFYDEEVKRLKKL